MPCHKSPWGANDEAQNIVSSPTRRAFSQFIDSLRTSMPSAQKGTTKDTRVAIIGAGYVYLGISLVGDTEMRNTLQGRRAYICHRIEDKTRLREFHGL